MILVEACPTNLMPRKISSPECKKKNSDAAGTETECEKAIANWSQWKGI